MSFVPVDNKMLASSEKGVNTGYAVMKIARQIVMDVCSGSERE